MPYRQRGAGSVSKLHTLRDGVRVLWTIFTLFRSFKPLTFFGGLGLLFFVAGMAAGLPPLLEWVEERSLARLPLAVLAAGLMLLGSGSVFVGITLHALNWRFLEVHDVLSRRQRAVTQRRDRTGGTTA